MRPPAGQIKSNNTIPRDVAGVRRRNIKSLVFHARHIAAGFMCAMSEHRFREDWGTMSEKFSFKDGEGRTFSGRFEVKNGIVTVTTSDGRTRSAAIEESMLGPETLAKTLLVHLHQDRSQDE